MREISRGPRRLLPVALFAVAVLIRVAFVLLGPKSLASDEIDYDDLAWTLAESGTYSVHGVPTAYRPVGYPAVVAAVYRVAGRNPTAVKLLQAACDAGTALLLFFLLSGRSRKAALLAGLGWSVFPPSILFSGRLLSESVFVFGLALFAYLLDKNVASGRKGGLAPGLLLGGLILVKPTMLLFAACIPAILAGDRAYATGRRLLVWACLPVALWLVRNIVVMHAPVLVTSTGVNLLIGNNPRATGGYLDPRGASERPDRSELAADREAMDEAIAFVRDRPLQFLINGARKVAYLLSSEAALAVGLLQRTEDAGAPRFRERFKRVPSWVHALVSLPTAIILIVGTAGLLSRRSDSLNRVFYALLFTILAATIVFFGSSRFRFPLMGLMTVFAAECAVAARARLSTLTRPRLVALVAVIGAMALVWVAESCLIYFPT